MTNTVLLKRSNTANAVPLAGNLTAGELALNYTDGNLFYKNNAGNVVLIASNQQLSLTGNVTASYFLGNANIQYTASTAPTTGNLIGAQWYNTSTDTLYEWQTDGTSNYWVDITGPVVGTTGVATGSIIVNGTSNVTIPVANGNVGINVGGTANVAAFATTGIYANGVLSATGNVQGGNLVLTTGNLTLGNVNLNTSNSAIQGWSYPTISLSIAASEGTSTGLFFGNAGSSFYVVGTTNDKVFQYNMSSTNMANTGVVFGNVAIAQDATPADLFIDSSGANLYVLGNTNRVVYQYTLSSPWNITTATYSTFSANISAQEATPNGLWFKPDLTTMYMVGTTNDTVYQYTLTTPGNIATAAYASKSFSVTSQEGTPTAVNLSSDGSKMWILGSAQTAIQEYNLATPWDVSTASWTRGNSYSVRIQETAPQGMFVDIANTRVWIVGQTSDTVFQYNTANSIIATANAVGIRGQLQVQGNAYFAEQTVFQNSVATEGALTVDSTLTGAATVTFSTTTSAINIGTSQTTGATIIGGTAQTANINIGRSTATQGIVIGNGVTASGSTKTIDIGTLGAANSITNINIGPTAGNATVAFLSNAQVSIANTGSAALSVVGNITGGNILTVGIMSSTGNATHGNISVSGIISATGGTNATGFAVGNSAVSNVALGYFPTAGTAAEMAIRDYSTVASTMYFDNSIGSANVNGSFQFRGSNAFTQWAKIDQYGVTLPTRPAFRVYGNSSTNWTAGTLTNQVIDYNQGSNYVNSTGIFTAPAPGLYHVWLNARAGSTASLSQVGVFKNNDVSNANTVVFWEITTSATTTTHFGVSSVVKLAVNDNLRVIIRSGGINFDGNDNWGVAYIG